MSDPVTMTAEEYRAEAVRRFGDDPLKWRFVCPACGHVVSGRDYLDAGAPCGAIGYNCIGRYTGSARRAFASGPKGTGPGPCDYSTGGLFNISPIRLTDGEAEQYMFELAEAAEEAHHAE